MRWLATLLLLPILTTTAAAHGSCWRGPNGGVPPGLREPSDPEPPPPPPSQLPSEPASAPVVLQRGIPCDCGLFECDTCSDEALRRGEEVQVSLPPVTVTKRWGDIARCRVEVMFETSHEPGTVEAYARIEPASLFAAVAGSVRNSEESLSAKLKPSEEARRKYLYARRLFDFDPLLVLRRGPGRLDLRVYPISKGEKAVVVLKGYILVDGSAPGRVRLYRTDGRYLAVVPLATDAHADEAAFRDERGGRSLHFLSEAQCRERFGDQFVEDVPFVPALESAVTGRGNRAASNDTALVAIAAQSPQPPFVGPDRVQSALPPGESVPPGLRGSADPEPPPEPAFRPE